jgi:hypothetical protein
MPIPSPSKESTPELLAGMVGDARDLIGAHLDRMQREIRGDVGNLADLIRTRALAIAGLVVAAVVGAIALGLGISAALGWPSWAGLAIVAVLVGALSLYKLLAPHRPDDATPDVTAASAFDDAKRDAEAVMARAADVIRD